MLLNKIIKDMALSHYKNSHAAINKWEVVNPSLFEVTILPPDFPSGIFLKFLSLLWE